MEYLSFNSIAKRCGKGTWLDEKTGECVPPEEWKKRNYKRNQQTEDKDKKGKCPKGKWRDDKTGECVSPDEWKRRNQKNYERNRQREKEKREKKNEVPPHIEYPEIEKNKRSSDISTAEAEWIFNQGSSKDAYQTKLDKNKKSIKSVRQKIDKMDANSTAKDYFKTLTEGEGLDFTFEDVEGEDLVGKKIYGDSEYRFASFTDIAPQTAKQCVEAMLTAKEHLHIAHPIKLGAVTTSRYYGVCWSKIDGTSAVRLSPEGMNHHFIWKPEENADYPCWNVAGDYTTATPIHELTHSYINSMVYDLIKKGQSNGGINAEGGNYALKCVEITHGDIPKDYRGRDVFRDENCSPSYVYAGRFTQQVLQDAKKVAKAIYGMDSDTFKSQQTGYGMTKSKEGLPEAVADYLTNGENATLANKLIYHSLQRYARFIYSDDEDIEPIQTYIKDLQSKQKGKKTKTQKCKNVDRDYISFAELIG